MADGIMVKIAPLGQVVREVTLPANATVADALRAAGIDPKKFDDLRHNGGKLAGLGDMCVPNDIITLIPNIRGGKRTK
jgi:hypothetical protein